MQTGRPLMLLQCFDALIARCHGLVARACDPYRPERHYMRGPGPKWHARHRAGLVPVAL